MGSSNSKLEQDKALQLCRERKRFVRQALDGRCSLAAAHVAYIHSLRNTATALRLFAQPSSSTPAPTSTPGQLALTDKSLSLSRSRFSFSSQPTASFATHTFSPSPSPPSSSTRFHANHMKFTTPTSVKVVEKPPSITTTQNTLPPPPPPLPDGTTSPWDYFGLDQENDWDGLHDSDHIRRLVREEEGIPDLEEDDNDSFSRTPQDFHESEDEFDEPPADTLVRSFKNLNTEAAYHVADTPSLHTPSARSVASEAEFSTEEKSKSPNLSPLRPTSSIPVPTDVKKQPAEEDCRGNKIAPKDFFSSIKEIEHLFIKASESGKEVPRMLEANKLHFRPMLHGRKGGSMTSAFFKVCFSCGEDHSSVPEEPVQAGVSYLTWHRTTSSHSSSSRNPLISESRDDTEGFSSNYCMNSGSHASTLDRLYAWERKLYDEIKASELIRREYDVKCKVLRQQESRGEAPHKADKFRAVVKDLHSRIRVAIHRINTISKRIEELRDKELQPQLEELIEGLRRMWEVMFECHTFQFEIISVAYFNSNTEISMHSESHWQCTIQLENEMRSLSSSFSRWIGAQRSYVQAIDGWLSKCVSLPKKPSRRKRRDEASSWRKCGPPIYVTCGEWLQMLDKLPAKEVVDSMKGLASETSRFVPSQEKNQGKSFGIFRDEASEVCLTGVDRIQSSLTEFLGQLNKFAECSVELYRKLEDDIKESKSKYDHLKSRP